MEHLSLLGTDGQLTRLTSGVPFRLYVLKGRYTELLEDGKPYWINSVSRSIMPVQEADDISTLWYARPAASGTVLQVITHEALLRSAQGRHIHRTLSPRPSQPARRCCD